MAEDSSNQANPPGAEPEAGPVPARAAPADASPDAGAGARSLWPAGLVPKLAIAAAVVATVVAAALWWQYQRFYLELARDDTILLGGLEDARSGLQRLESDLEDLRGAIGASRDENASLRGDLEAVPAEMRALERRIDALQGGQVDARDHWLRERAEYYLVLANTELTLLGRTDSAAAALELADDAVRDLGDPRLGGVRGAIAAELQALRAVRLPDLEGAAAALAALVAQAAELPMRAGPPENFDSENDTLDEVEPGLGRLWAATKGAVTSIIRVERIEEPVGMVLSESERRLIRRQLALELQFARIALLERRQEAFRASLGTAEDLLSREFERAAPAVAAARRTLAEMTALALNPELPAIGDSLTLFRAASGSN